MTIQEAVCHTNQLEAFSLLRPENICPRMISTLSDLRKPLTHLSLEERVQTICRNMSVDQPERDVMLVAMLHAVLLDF
jgi:hypothetical protein